MELTDRQSKIFDISDNMTKKAKELKDLIVEDIRECDKTKPVSTSSPCSTNCEESEISKLKREIDRAHDLINFLYESGALGDHEAKQVQSYFGYKSD